MEKTALLNLSCRFKGLKKHSVKGLICKQSKMFTYMLLYWKLKYSMESIGMKLYNNGDELCIIYKKIIYNCYVL